MERQAKENRQVIKEYLEAVDDGNVELAQRIREANPDVFRSEGSQGSDICSK